MIETKEDFRIVKEMVIAGSIVVVIVVAVLGGCSYLNDVAGVEDDGPIEELIEEIVEAKTGIAFDLSPDTPED